MNGYELLGRDILIYISLLIIFCIIEYVTNKKKTLNLKLYLLYFLQ